MMVMDIGSLSIRFWGDEKRDMLPLFAALLMVQLFDLVPRLAGHMDAEPLVELDVLLRDDDGEVRVAAAQTAELLLRELGDGVRQRRDAQRDKHLVRVQARVVVPEAFNLEL